MELTVVKRNTVCIMIGKIADHDYCPEQRLDYFAVQWCDCEKFRYSTCSNTE